MLADVKNRCLETKQRRDGCVTISFLPNREGGGIREKEGDDVLRRGTTTVVKGIKESVYDDAIFTPTRRQEPFFG